MDVEKLREYAHQPTHTTKRKLNKNSKEIIVKFENLDTVEETQLLSILLLKDKLKEPLKLQEIDTSVKKGKTSKLKKDIVESIKEGLHSIGKKSRSPNKRLWKERSRPLLYHLILDIFEM